MKRREIRERLEDYMSLGPNEAYVVYQMSEMVQYPLGKLLQEAASPDALRALAAVSLLPLCFGEDGYSALETVAAGHGFGARFAAEALRKEAPAPTEAGPSAPTQRGV